MMKTALFVALAMAHGTTASDQSRVATELDEDLTPEEVSPPVPGGNTSPLPTNIADAFDTTTADLLFGTTAAPVSTASVTAAFATAGYTVGAQKTAVTIPGVSIAVTFTVKTLPVVQAAAGGLDQAVTMKMTADRAQIESNTGDYKLVFGLTLAKDLKILYSQLAALQLTFISPTTGLEVTVGREAKALSAGDVDVAFNICANAGCLGTSSVGISKYSHAQLALAAFDRTVATRDFAFISAIFAANAVFSSTLTGTNANGFIPVSFTVRSVPVQKATPAGSTNVLFYMGVDVDWSLISGVGASQYKMAWQYAIAQLMNIHPYQVTEIFFVRMSSTPQVTVGRHATAQAIERVNAHMTVCPNKCAPNVGGGTLPPAATVPPSFSDDDDSSIIAVAVIVPIAVIAIVLVIIYYLMCGGEEKKPEPEGAPYGDEADGPAAPEQEAGPVPEGDEVV